MHFSSPREGGGLDYLPSRVGRVGRLIVLSIVMLMLAVGPLCAQTSKVTGDIRGTVVDSSGAIVPGAEITVTNVGTALVKKTASNEQGSFFVPDLQPGVYNVTIAKTGFKEFLTKGLELHTSTTAVINAQLQVGAIAETVEVSADEVQVQAETSAVGDTITGAQVSNLPLNGDNFVQLTQLVPGVSGANGANASLNLTQKGVQGGVDMSVNGNPTTNNLFLLDGANNNDKGSNRTILVYPTVDSIAEFKMLRNSYGPEYGQASGAIISIVTKSGENAFHGSVNYTGRNEALDAFDYFAKYNNPNPKKDKQRYNDFGYTLGGPIIKNKLFFFWSEAWNKRIQGATQNFCSPTPAELAGDFSGPGIVAGGQSVDGCPGAVAPTLDPSVTVPGNPLKLANPDKVGLLLANFLPAANSPLVNGQNYHSSVPTKSDWREENIKVDYNLSKNNVIEGRFTHDSWNSPAPNGVGWGTDPGSLIQADWNQPSSSAIAKLSSTLGKQVNTVQFSYSRNAIKTSPGGQTSFPGGASALLQQINSGIASTYPQSGKTGGIPVFWGGFGPYQNGDNLWLITPYSNDMETYTVNDDLIRVSGNHTFRAGVLWSFNRKSEDQGGGTDTFGGGDGGPGNGLTMTGAWGLSNATGNALANLLYPNQHFLGTESNVNPRDHGRWTDFEFYLGDTWKVRRNVTIDYGFRWSFMREPYEANNLMSSFSPLAYDPNKPATDACNGIVIVPGTDPCGDANKQNAALGFPTTYSSGTPGPNRALRQNNNHNIAPRFGIAWDIFGDGKTAFRAGAGQFFQRERMGSQVLMSANSPFLLTTSFILRPLDPQNYPGETIPTPATATAAPLWGYDARGVTPNSWQWHVTLERELAKNTTLEVGYVGNRGIHLSDRYDINYVPAQNRYAAAFSSGAATNAFRQFTNDGSIRYFARNGSSSYHSLQTMFKSHIKHAADISASYTWSHSLADVDLDDGGNGLSTTAYYDPTNPHLDYGNSPINRPHIFTANAIFHFPTFANGNSFKKNVLGQWDLAVIQTAESGPSITVYAQGVGPSGTAQMAIPTTISGTGNGNNNRPNVVSGVSCNDGQDGPQILNPNAFTVTGMTIGGFGNAPKGYCHGARTFDTDLALYKTWTITERVKLQFRIDAFNLFNHTNFRNDFNGSLNQNWEPSTGSLLYNQASHVITSGTLDPIYANNFGKATSTLGGIGSRNLQYGLKVIF